MLDEFGALAVFIGTGCDIVMFEKKSSRFLAEVLKPLEVPK